ncbi:MAG: ABC transporter permease [Erysipelothrix sp.]|nr:ABC transporter permease [Erysipelothrix sp.]
MKELFNNEAVNSLDEMNLKKRRTREVQNVINGDPSKGLARINTRMLKDFQGIKAALVITVVLLISINALTGYLLDVADENVTVFDTEIWIQPYDDEVDMYQQTSDTEKILQPYDIQRVDSIYYSDYLNIAAINGKTMEEPSSIVIHGMDDALFDDFIKEHSLSKKDQLILLNKYDEEEFSQSMDVSDKDILNISNRQTDGMESMDVEVDVVLKKIEEKYDYLYGGERIIITRLSNLKDNLYPLSKTQEVKIFISSDLSVENLKEINNKIDDLGYTGVYLYSEYYFSSFKQTVKTVVSVLTSFIFVYIGFVILVNVVNISISNYQKRKQDIAVLKSMGATSKQLDKMYLYETLYIVSVPWVLGIVLGHLLNIGVFILIRVLLPVSSLKYSINIKTFGLSFILV